MANDVCETVSHGYAKIAKARYLSAATDLVSCGCCCGNETLKADELAQRIGYFAEQIVALPQGSNMGLSCGNPSAIASLKPGQVVLDLGSGDGFDVFLAWPKVGPKGPRDRRRHDPGYARQGPEICRFLSKSTRLDNVEFRLGEIEHLPIGDASVDVVISNRVIYLSPDNPQVWKGIARALKPGGTVAITLHSRQILPPLIEPQILQVHQR